jgi:hypothetical protein
MDLPASSSGYTKEAHIRIVAPAPINLQDTLKITFLD